MKNTLIKFLKWTTLTNIGRIITSFAFASLFLWLSNITNNVTSDVMWYTFLTFISVFAGHIMLFIAFAWVINPIRESCGYYLKKAGKGEIKNTKFCKALFKNAKEL